MLMFPFIFEEYVPPGSEAKCVGLKLLCGVSFQKIDLFVFSKLCNLPKINFGKWPEIHRLWYISVVVIN